MAAEPGFQGLFDIVKVRWRLLAWVALAAAVMSSVLSAPIFIEPRYNSNAIVYPVNLNSYSTETRTEQLMQLLESNAIRDSIIAKFDLAVAYDIDTGMVAGRYHLNKEYQERVTVRKTRQESVVIDVVDEDPVKARDMVREILRQTDLLARRLQREKSAELLEVTRVAMERERRKLDSVEHRMDQLRRDHGLLAYEGQTMEVTRGYMRMLAANSPGANREEARRLLEALETHGGEFRGLAELSNYFRGNYDRLLSDHQRILTDVTKELTYTDVLVEPEVNDKKVYPIRWLIVLVSTLSAILLAFILLALRPHLPRT